MITTGYTTRRHLLPLKVVVGHWQSSISGPFSIQNDGSQNLGFSPLDVGPAGRTIALAFQFTSILPDYIHLAALSKLTRSIPAKSRTG